ncbi:hypothetical protein SOVF_203000 [Spinacia oleracea]|nr:hypothetical protein SOVF_203000 [Spinacia oleracea]
MDRLPLFLEGHWLENPRVHAFNFLSLVQVPETIRPIALAQANAAINRIDILCEAYAYLQIAGASLFGILLSKYDPVTCVKFAAGFMIWGLLLAVALTWLTNMV